MKICGALLVVTVLVCGAVAPVAHAASGIELTQATPAQPAAPAIPPAQPGQPAADTSLQAADEPAGNVATLKGTATVTRNGMTGPLKLQDEIYKGDTLQTGKNATLGITFTDDTTLNLSASSRIVVDNFVYQEGGKDNAALINVARGTMAFVAAAVARTGDMKIETPTATLGIRGTTGVVEVPEGASAASANNVGVKLYPDADGKVGRIEVKARDGAPLGMLTQGASGFTVRGMMVSGFGMRMSAMPMVMSAQMVARDRAFVQRIHTMQGIGRQIVMQQRNFRMQNPQRPPAFGRGPQRPGFNQPGQPRGGFNQPGNQPGQRGQPGLNRPGQPNRPGLNQPGPQRQPGLQNPPGQRGGLQPGVGQPGRPGLPNQGGLQRPPGAPNQFGQRPNPQALPNQPGLPRQTGVPGGGQRPSIAPNAPALQGPAGILNRLGVPGRIGIPQVPTQQMPPAFPRAGQQVLPSAQKKLPQLQRQKQPPKELLR
ncbi:MAG: FecR domain-containing protein [Pseudomonadota bacterium]